MNYDRVLVRFGEMTLKKDNYKYFLDRIIRDINNKLSEFKNLEFSHEQYRFYIYLNGESFEDVSKKLQTVPGIYSYSPCVKVENDIEKIANISYELLKTRTNKVSFKVETNRGDKRFPLTSLEVSRKVAGFLLPKLSNYSVDVHNPDILVSIEVL